MISLSQKQREIVEYADGPVLVKAGPGSGKTRVLIERIKYLISTHRRTKVLALTFSNMAADEMKNRIQEDLADNDLIENVTLGTIHSFCLDIVQTRGYLIGLPKDLALFENSDDRRSILKDFMLHDPDLKKVLNSAEKPGQYLSGCLDAIAKYKKEFVLPDDPRLSETDSKIYKGYNDALLQQGAIDFDDILFYAYRILSENKSISKLFTTQYQYICVDEAQDLNYAQYQVLKALCGDSFKNIMLVGDENQSIYGFNGSDSSLMSKQFVSDYNPTVFVLNENFRSAKAIVNFANTLENSCDYPNCYYDGELTFTSYETEEAEANAIMDKISFLIESGHKDIEKGLTYSDIAIIARNRYVFSKIEAVLSNNNIPYFFKRSSTGIDSESDIFKLFDLELRLISNPRDIIHVKEKEQLISTIDTDSVNFISDCVKSIVPDQLNLTPVLRKIKDWTSAAKLNEEEKYLVVNDEILWRQHWEKYISLVLRENRTITSFRNYVALGKTQIVESTSGISLLTAHMSKGLQYEVVFVIGLSEGTFPDYRAVQAGGTAIEQEKNNMFVAVTRAKRLCYLSNSQYKQMPWGDVKVQVASRFVQPLIVCND